MKKEKHNDPPYYENNPKAKPAKEQGKIKKPFKVKVQSWNNGSLRSYDQYFENKEQAFEFCNSVRAQLAKIYNEDDELIHTTSKNYNTYA